MDFLTFDRPTTLNTSVGTDLWESLQRLPVSNGKITIKKPAVSRTNKTTNHNTIASPRSNIKSANLKNGIVSKTNDSSMTVVTVNSLPEMTATNNTVTLTPSVLLQSSSTIVTPANSSYTTVSPVTLIPVTNNNSVNINTLSTPSAQNKIASNVSQSLEITSSLPNASQVNCVVVSDTDTKSHSNQANIIQMFSSMPMSNSNPQSTLNGDTISIVTQHLTKPTKESKSKKAADDGNKVTANKSKPKAVKKVTTKRSTTSNAGSRTKTKKAANETEIKQLKDLPIESNKTSKTVNQKRNGSTAKNDVLLSDLNLPSITLSDSISLTNQRDLDIEKLRQSLVSKKCMISKWIQIKENDLREQLKASKRQILLEQRKEHEQPYIDFLLAQKSSKQIGLFSNQSNHTVNKIPQPSTTTNSISNDMSSTLTIDSFSNCSLPQVAASNFNSVPNETIHNSPVVSIVPVKKERKTSAATKRKMNVKVEATSTVAGKTNDSVVQKPKRIRKKKEPTKATAAVAAASTVAPLIPVDNRSVSNAAVKPNTLTMDSKTTSLQSTLNHRSEPATNALMLSNASLLTSSSSNPFIGSSLDVDLCSSNFNSGRTTDQLFSSSTLNGLSGLSSAADLLPNPTISDSSSLLSLSDVNVSNLPPVDDSLVASIVATLPSLNGESIVDGAVSFADADFNEVLNKLPDDSFSDLFDGSLKVSMDNRSERIDLNSLERPFASVAKQPTDSCLNANTSQNQVSQSNGTTFAPVNINAVCQTESNQSLNMNDSDIIGLANNILGSLTTEQQQQFNGLIDGALASATLATTTQMNIMHKSNVNTYVTSGSMPLTTTNPHLTVSHPSALPPPPYSSVLENKMMNTTYNSTLETPTTPTPSSSSLSLAQTTLAPSSTLSNTTQASSYVNSCVMTSNNGCNSYSAMLNNQFNMPNQSTSQMSNGLDVNFNSNSLNGSMNNSLSAMYGDVEIMLNDFQASHSNNVMNHAMQNETLGTMPLQIASNSDTTNNMMHLKVSNQKRNDAYNGIYADLTSFGKQVSSNNNNNHHNQNNNNFFTNSNPLPSISTFPLMIKKSN